ncbi:uncharacterized protein BO80DRAFT_104734 [Aspergillus ibericus CBS 121593]|uniref:Uncharacterized protein n=1 Tax=Aspergillus ibericus CBS 121593 TaxID=1448316 RepID=A0A395GXL0_9EURO|nr:hypothetical protein BO80DRAFT_104734 [Aspergillus ibericus CBS 121593]RAL00287.1 hypothetical protein BO80DRAFT_104734 [Aspergillus ibericus CBS 121593]
MQARRDRGRGRRQGGDCSYTMVRTIGSWLFGGRRMMGTLVFVKKIQEGGMKIPPTELIGTRTRAKVKRKSGRKRRSTLTNAGEKVGKANPTMLDRLFGSFGLRRNEQRRESIGRVSLVCSSFVGRRPRLAPNRAPSPGCPVHSRGGKKSLGLASQRTIYDLAASPSV